MALNLFDCVQFSIYLYLSLFVALSECVCPLCALFPKKHKPIIVPVHKTTIPVKRIVLSKSRVNSLY